MKENAQKTIDSLLETRNELKQDMLNHGNNITMSNSESLARTEASILLALGEAQSIEIERLQNLRFPTMNHRHFEIPIAHRKTFR